MKLLKLKDVNSFFSTIFVFKTINNLSYSPIQFQVRNVPQYGLRNNNRLLEVPFTRHRYIELFIGTRGPVLWNNIPEAIKNKNSVFSFKYSLKKYYLDAYE